MDSQKTHKDSFKISVDLTLKNIQAHGFYNEKKHTYCGNKG